MSALDKPSAAPLSRPAAERDQLLQAALDFIRTLTGMEPPPIKVAEVFAPFRDFVDRVQAITRQHVAAEAAPVLPEIKDMNNAPQQLHGSDRAFWVLGWNECRDAVRDAARAAALPKAANDAAIAAKGDPTP